MLNHTFVRSTKSVCFSLMTPKKPFLKLELSLKLRKDKILASISNTIPQTGAIAAHSLSLYTQKSKFVRTMFCTMNNARLPVDFQNYDTKPSTICPNTGSHVFMRPTEHDTRPHGNQPPGLGKPLRLFM